MYKQLRLYIDLYINNQNVFLLRNDNLYSIYTFQIISNQIEFGLTSINQEFRLFCKSLNKQSIQ